SERLRLVALDLLLRLERSSMRNAVRPVLAGIPLRNEATVTNILEFALDKIDADLHFLMARLREMLEETGEKERARRLPFVGDEPVRVRSGGDVAALTLAFQLLNLIEENASAQARRQREENQGLLREPGLWGQNLRQLIELGLSPQAIADGLAEVRVEPVLTAHPTE